ncbi:Alpha/Beta hydrolase protein [Boeremia exigua]|uniref:Alpha/Beta hydrolase protein n=1 Tax=Boeremia exigua TaxID=749465 RepID=UPI001E8DCCD0|nr:Alpha/Beta hydrolase protein [Boeremia exigua]KAH6613056.1 Alpha/Beta hydrolase protein [Boeremia exigua]
MPFLDLPNAKLHYDTFGTGPLLLCIPGADGRGAVFHDAAKFLSRSFRVVCYDRRGYSQSQHIGAQDLKNRLATDADDAGALISHLSTEPAAVFGTSSGAIVATQLLIQHPDRVHTLVAHEPPAFALLPEESRTQAAGLIERIYSLYREQGVQAAMEVFSGGLSTGEEGARMRFCMDPTRGDEIRANSMFWFEFELRQYTSALLDVERIKAERTKYVPAAGSLSGDGPGVGPIALLAHMLGKEVERLTGGHISYMYEPEAFSDALVALLQSKSQK